MKKIFVYGSEAKKLIERETSNYLKIRHPFLPKFYGTIKEKKYIVIEFINGKTLDNVQINLTYHDKITIIFELMILFDYLHYKELIYRDLKPNNIMINENKTVILIDFDRLIDNNTDSTHTLDFASDYVDSNINETHKFSYRSDIYSLGKIYDYLINEHENTEFIENQKIKMIFKNCSSISDLICQFNSNFHTKTEQHFNAFLRLKKNYMDINHNTSITQFNLGLIYGTGKYITRDINKAIYYYSLAANQNDVKAQFNLGVIYLSGEYITRDINKAIYYFSLAANQNDADAQFNLGVIYGTGEYITRDINKAIHYYSLAANQNDADSQFNLGVIYEAGEYITRDINKAIHYYSLAANQNYARAQFRLGILYFTGIYVSQDITKGKYYIIKASLNMNRMANFAHGFLLHEGKYVKRDIQEAILFYKETSSFNNQYAKNNLGIIYKNGFGKEVNKNAFNAIVYFEEAIRQKNDYLSMYNLAHIYLFDDTVEHVINKSIELLIKSSDKFFHSFNLLLLLLIKQYGFNNIQIKKEIEKRINKKEDSSYTLLSIIHIYVNLFAFLGMTYVDIEYESYRKKDFVYNIQLKPIQTSDLEKKISPKYPNAKNITSDFYDGFGILIHNSNQ